MSANDQLREWVEKPLNPWLPERDAIRLAVLGKFAEELAECSAIVARCVIQGIDEAEPVTGKPNRLALENEIADIIATAEDTARLFGLREDYIDTRADLKRKHLARWHDLLRPPSEGSADNGCD